MRHTKTSDVYRIDLKGKKVFVLGSGPNSRPPKDIESIWEVLTVNGSQSILDKWSCKKPFLSLFSTLILKNKSYSIVTRDVLVGRATKNLIVVNDKMNKCIIWIKLKLLRYGYENLFVISPDQRKQIIASVLNNNYETIPKPSNGVFLAILAIYLGAEEVLMSGFSLTKAGHAYNDMNMKRSHSNEDREILRRIIEIGLPIFTNDPEFSNESGLVLMDKI